MAEILRKYFGLFNEIGIIAQLARTMMEEKLPPGLSQPHFSVLNHLVRLGDGVTPLELSRSFQVPKNSMTNTLAGLAERGLVEVRPNPNDARSKHVYLTRLGRNFREHAIDALAPDFKQIAAKVRAQDVDTLLPLLTHIRQVLDEKRKTQKSRREKG